MDDDRHCEDSDDSQSSEGSEFESEDGSSSDEQFSDYDEEKINTSQDNLTTAAQDEYSPDYSPVVNESRRRPARDDCYTGRKYNREKLSEEAAETGVFLNNFIVVYFVVILLASWMILANLNGYTRPPVSGNATWHDASQREMSHIRREHAKIFPSQQDHFWRDLVSTQKTLFADRKTPAVYLLLHGGEPNSAHCVAEVLIHLSEKFIFKKSARASHLNSSHLSDRNISDYGTLLTKLKMEITRSKILVVTELEKMPPEMARVFHQLCDDINPTIREAVYVFVLNVAGNPKFQNPESRNPTEIADEVLVDMWKDLHTDIVRPLVTRLTASVFFIENEANLGKCDLGLALPVDLNDFN